MEQIRDTSSDRLRSDERGFTLVELVVAMSILMVVLGGALTMIQIVVKSEPTVRERTASIQEGRTLTATLTRELRQTYVVHTATATNLEFSTYVRKQTCGGTTYLPANEAAIACRVRYACAGGICTRTEMNPSDVLVTGQAVRLVEGLRADTIFTYQGAAGNPTYVGVSLSFPNDEGGEEISISDGVGLRNVGTQS